MSDQIAGYLPPLKSNKLLSSLIFFTISFISFIFFVFLPLWLQNELFVSPWLLALLYTTIFFLFIVSAVKLEWVVLTAVILIGFVRFEPAPVDVIFSVLLILTLLRRDYQNIKEPFLTHLFVFLIIITNFTALQNIVDFKVAATYITITLYLIGLFYFIKIYSKNHLRMLSLTRAYVASAAISVIASYAGLFGIGTELVLYGGKFWTNNYFRLQGFFKDPNVFGPFLVPAVIILIESFFNKDLLKLNNFFKALLLIIVLSGLFLSFSRGALLNFSLALLVLFGLKVWKRQLGKKFIIIIAIFAIAFSFLVVAANKSFLPGDTGSQNVAGLGGRKVDYDAERFEYQGKALDVALNNPLGLGPGQFTSYKELATHQLYLRLLSEQGFLGLIGFIGLAALIIINIMKSGFSDNKIVFSLSLVIIASLSGIMANSFFIDTLHWRHLWFLLGLGWAVFTFSKLKTLEFSNS